MGVAAAAAAFMALGAAPAFAQQGVTYFDSNIVQVTTLAATSSTSTPPGTNLGPGTYSLVCAPVTASSVYVGWTANTQNPATGTVWTYTMPTQEAVQSVATAQGSGSIVTNKYSEGYFVIQDSSDHNLSNVAGPCAPLPVVSSDAPSNLNVFTNGPGTIYLNWKDNSTSTATSTFQIQRFQVTPLSPTSAQANPQSLNAISVSWSDNITSSTPPFYTLIERSTNADFSGNLVTYATTTSPLVDSSNLTLGQTYYYRLTNVSQVPVNSFYQYPTSTQVAKPASPSSTPVTTSVRLVAAAPATSFLASLSQAVSGFFHSLFGAPDASAQTAPVVNYNDYFQTIATVTTPSYADTGLVPGMVYMYRVRLVYPNGGTSTWSNMVAAVTLPQNASLQTNSNAPICTAYGFCNHSIGEYAFGTQASEVQCSVNAECRGVGRASQQTSEQ